MHTLESKGLPLACHNIYPAKIPRGSNVASKAIPRIIRHTSALHTRSYNTRSPAYPCVHIFMQSYICIYMCISIFTRIHTYHASRFPKIPKEKDRRLWRKEDKLLRRILVLLSKKRDAFHHASCMSMPCHNRIIKTIKVVIEQGLFQQRV